METERWAGSRVTGFMLHFLKLAICSISFRDKRSDTQQYIYGLVCCIFPWEHRCYRFQFSKSNNVITKVLIRYLWVAFPYLYLVLWPCPQETLHDAQLDQELQTQEAWQLSLVQRSCPSEQLQLLQSTWCQLPAAQICPSESTQSHCHSCTHIPSCCNWPERAHTHTHTHTVVI